MRSSRDQKRLDLMIPPSSSRNEHNELLAPPYRQRFGSSLSPRKEENPLRQSMSTSKLVNELGENGDEAPEAKSPYNGLTHGVRRMMPHELACRMGCRGAKCKYDRSDCWEREQMAIKGVYSHWVTEDILAMARPRDDLIKNHDLIHRMKKAGIRSIFNLQSRNEHKECGDGVLKETGFSYDPNDFTSEHIYYYNFELEDYSVASTMKMLDMVKVLAFAITEGKAAIHCHAGLGRTGLFIACYLIYAHRMTANEAIHFIREKRPSAVQMNDQIQAVKDFESFIKPMRIVYSKTVPTSLDQLANQTSSLNNLVIYSTSFNLNTFLHRQKLFLHGYERKNLKYIPKIIYVCGEQLKRLSHRWTDDGMNNDVKRKIEKISNELAKDLLESTRKGDEKPNKFDEINPNVMIAKALATNHFPRKILKKVKKYQDFINENNDGLDDLVNEEDPLILSALIWSWIVELKEPILRDQELNILLKEYSNNTQFSSNFKIEMEKVNWNDLDQGTLHTVNYLIEIIHELLPLERTLEDKIICHLIACLTHTKLKYDHDEYELEETTSQESDDYGKKSTRANNTQENIAIHKSNKKMQKKQFLILHKIIREVCQKPFKVEPHKPLGNSRFQKTPRYHYEEDVDY